MYLERLSTNETANALAQPMKTFEWGVKAYKMALNIIIIIIITTQNGNPFPGD